ncbi:hypothetical protein ABZ438_20205 [Streptomyces sp. NPDC005786]|uniref:hypothetical protein n=1 Tax=unclassified Streptomyces TaxID=2593676 RepID=UPI00340763DD
MGEAALTLSAAVIGSAVSLVSVLVTQRLTQQVHRREQDRIERHRQEDLVQARAGHLLEERQAVYVRFSAAARTARDALAACMYDLRREGALEDTSREELKARWDAYVAQHAEAHIIASQDVLGMVGRVNGALRQIYGLVKRLDTGPQDPGDSVDALRERIDGLWPSLVALREGMRRDLGLQQPADPPPS